MSTKKDHAPHPGFSTAARCPACRELVTVRGGRQSCGCTEHAEMWARALMGMGPSDPFPLNSDPRWAALRVLSVPAITAPGPISVAAVIDAAPVPEGAGEAWEEVA